MKKLLFSAAMAAMLCAACTEGIDEVQTSTQFDTFSANMNTTRTDMGDDYSVLWNEGDLVTIFNKTTDNLQYAATNVDGTSATLTYKDGWREKKTLENNYAIYPYDAEATLSDDVLSTSIAAEQTYQADNDLYYAVAVAKSANTSFTFNNATSLLRCHLNTVIGGTTLKSIKVESKSTNIAGKVTIDMANGAVAEVVEGEGSKTIILNCGDVELTNDFTIFNIALAAGTFPADDLTYTYTVDIDGEERTFEYPISKEVTFEAGAFRQTKFTFTETFDGNTSEAISYAEAIAEVLNSGQDVTLEKEVVLTKPLTITGTATLNLNGQTISANFDSATGAIINNSGTLTLTGNGTISNSAVNGAAVISNSGNLVLDGVTIQGAPIGETDWPAYAITNSGSLTVEDGTTITTNRGAISLSAGADVTINGGDITVDIPSNRPITAHVIYAYGRGSKLTIKGGNITNNYTPTSDKGASVICPAGASIEIFGGNFTFNGPSGQGGCIQNYMGYGVPVYVYGGTFNDNSVSKNLADGYIAYANDNGTYTVKAGVKLDNIADFETALSNAVPGSTIILPKNISETITVGEMKDVIIEGSENTTMIFSTNANTKIENVTLKKINFEYTGATRDCGVVIDKDAQIDNLALEGCTFTGTGVKDGRGLSGFNNSASIVISNCTFKDMGYPIYAWGGYESLTIEGCTFNNIQSWAIMPQSGFNGDLTVDNCNFVDCLGGGLVKAGTLTAGHTFTFTNNTITGCTIAGDHNWFQFNVSAGSVVMSNNTKDGEPWTPGVADGLK